jgi:hypothetical protein
VIEHTLIWCISIENELSNKRAGRKTAKRRSGFMLAPAQKGNKAGN